MREPRTIEEYRRHLHEWHGAPPTSSIDHRSLSSLAMFHTGDHIEGYGPKWAAYKPHTHGRKGK